MYTLKKEFVVETAHILDNSYMEECQRFHGHSAKIVVAIASIGLNEAGMVMDFKMLKELFMPLYRTLDHHCLVSENRMKQLKLDFPGLQVVPFNPTAENIAKWLFDSFSDAITKARVEHKIGGGNFYLDYVEYWETSTACVRYDPNY